MSSLAAALAAAAVFAIPGAAEASTGSAERPPVPTAPPPKSSPYDARLQAEATALIKPLTVYEQSVTAAEQSTAQTNKQTAVTAINHCDARYSKQLFLGLNMSSKNPAMEQRVALYGLWANGSLMQQYEIGVAAFATPLEQLVSAWSALSLSTPGMSDFVHGLVTELNASLSGPQFDTCTFVNEIAAHHFSYTWASSSSYGQMAAQWWKTVSTAGNETSAFWGEMQRTVKTRNGGLKTLPGPWSKFFTHSELSQLANLPGELG